MFSFGMMNSRTRLCETPDHINSREVRVLRWFSFALALAGLALPGMSQNAAQPSTPPPVHFTAEQDHQNMMDQLGIKALRPGPSGNEEAPNHANYDESKANPFPDLPDALTLKSDKKVTTATEWWHERRPEIVEDFEREVFGRVPPNVPKVTWTEHFALEIFEDRKSTRLNSSH